MKALILAAGDGTRLGAIGRVTNKHLMPVWDRPMIDWVLAKLAEISIDTEHIGVVVSRPYAEDVKRYLGPKYTYLDQGEGDGIGHSVLCGRDFVGTEPFVVHLGDQIYSESLKRHYENWLRSKAQIHLILRQYEHANRHTVVNVQGRRVVSLIEKPKEPEAGYIMAGMSFYTPDIFQILEKLKKGYAGEYQLSDAVDQALQAGFTVSWTKLHGDWVDAGTPENLLSASLLMKKISMGG